MFGRRFVRVRARRCCWCYEWAVRWSTRWRLLPGYPSAPPCCQGSPVQKKQQTHLMKWVHHGALLWNKVMKSRDIKDISNSDTFCPLNRLYLFIYLCNLLLSLIFIHSFIYYLFKYLCIYFRFSLFIYINLLTYLFSILPKGTGASFPGGKMSRT